MREILYRVVLKDARRPPAFPIAGIPSRKGIRLETLSTNLDQDGNIWRIVEVVAPEDQIDGIADAFLASPVKLEKEILERSRSRLLLWYKYPAQHVGRGISLTYFTFQRLGREVVITDRVQDDGLIVRILARSSRDLSDFVRELREVAERDHEFTLLYVGPPRSRTLSLLVPEDEEVLRTARATGYFDVPRSTGLDVLARGLGCAKSTASYRLRKAQARLIDSYYGVPAARQPANGVGKRHQAHRVDA